MMGGKWIFKDGTRKREYSGHGKGDNNWAVKERGNTHDPSIEVRGQLCCSGHGTGVHDKHLTH